MVTRRKLILSGATGLLAAALPHASLAADDPAGIVTAIYTRAAKGKGDGGGGFVIGTRRQEQNTSRNRWSRSGPRRTPARRRRCRAGRFRPRHQLAGSGREIVQSGRREARGRQGHHHRYDRWLSGSTAKPADQTMRYDLVREAGFGRSTTSRAAPTANRGRSAACSPPRSNTSAHARAKSGQGLPAREPAGLARTIHYECLASS